jgi:hypothetical protein
MLLQQTLICGLSIRGNDQDIYLPKSLVSDGREAMLQILIAALVYTELVMLKKCMGEESLYPRGSDYEEGNSASRVPGLNLMHVNHHRSVRTYSDIGHVHFEQGNKYGKNTVPGSM